MKRSLSVLLAVVMLLASFSVASAESVGLMAVEDPVITFTQRVVTENGVTVTKIAANITCSTSGAVIYYTTNGSTPTKSSIRYDGSIIFEENEDITLKAIAYQSSSSSTSSKVVSKNKVGYRLTVSRSPSYDASSNPSVIVITMDGLQPGEILRYTIDGKAPSESGSYEESRAIRTTINITKTTILSWQVYRNGYEPTFVYQSKVTAKDWIDSVLIPSWRREYVYGGVRLRGETETEGATIHYKVAKSALNNKEEYPEIKEKVTAKDTVYTGPLEFTEVGMYTIKSYAEKSGSSDSNQVLVTQKIEACSKPKFTVGSASGGRKKLTITAGEGEEIYFTRNGTKPTRNSEKYTEPIYIGTECTVMAIAVRQGYVDSSVGSQKITGVSGGDVVLSAPTRGDVMESPVGIKTIPLSAASPEAQIRYNVVSGSAKTSDIPTANKPGTLYTEPIVFERDGTWALLAKTATVDSKGSYTLSDGYLHLSVKVERIPETNIIKNLSNGIKTVTFPSIASGDIYYVVRPGTNNFLKAEQIEATEANRYIYPITVNQTSSLSAVTVNANGSRSVVYNANITVNGTVTPEQVPAPTVSYVSGGVTIDCSDKDADIFYVLDNLPDTVATAAGTGYERGTVIPVIGSSYIHVVAMKPGFTPSVVTVATSQQGNKTATPVITILQAGTSSYSGTISCTTPGAVIYYTVDGSEPTTSSTRYSGYISEPLTAISVVKAIAVAPGLLRSDVAVKLVKGDSPLGVVVEDKDVYGGKGVKLATPTMGAYIYYTLDGTTPSAGNGKYYNGEEILISTPGTVVLKAVATLPGYSDSAVTEKTYVLAKLLKPKVNSGDLGEVVDGKLVSYKGVEMSYPGTESGVKIVYTTDGSAPGANSELYTHRVDFYEDIARIRIAAIKEGYVTSDEFVTSVKIVPAVPQLKLRDSKYILGGVGVAFACDLPGVEMYYSYDLNSSSYIPFKEGDFAPLTSPSQTLYVIGRKNGLKDSVPYVISSRKMAVATMPVANPITNSIVNSGDEVRIVGGMYSNPVDENLDTYEIFYTTDGTDPTLESEKYTGPITIDAETEIRAAAAGIGHALSSTAIFYYRIAGEATDVQINTAGLKNEGGLLYGVVKVSGADKLADSGKAILALYSGDRMLTASTQKLSGNMTFNIDENSRVTTDGGSITVKLFVFDSLESLVPLSKVEKRIY